jgi:hypothetical protein
MRKSTQRIEIETPIGRRQHEISLTIKGMGDE